jgi:hypothetical protein
MHTASTSQHREIPVTPEQAANIRYLVSLRNKTAAEIGAVYPRTHNGTRVIRIDFEVERPLAGLDLIALRAALVGDAIIPAAQALGLRLQCGEIEANATVTA